MTGDLVARVETACAQLVDAGQAVTFTAVASRAGMAKATLYRRPELRAIIEQRRVDDREAHTLSGIIIELDQLRQSLEAVAAKVRRHEEELRTLKRRSATKK
jgi:AcrR family transcriptional regulator